MKLSGSSQSQQSQQTCHIAILESLLRDRNKLISFFHLSGCREAFYWHCQYVIEAVQAKDLDHATSLQALHQVQIALGGLPQVVKLRQ